jgi:membrane peptidoglycan carboxypeptidase
MASAYAVIANGGYRLTPYAIAEIRDASGGLLFEQRPRAVSVLRQSTAQTVAAMMSEVIKRGTASGAASRAGGLPFFAAGKTGTTSDYKDAWFIGWGGGLSCAVWVGNDDARRMVRVTGGSVPASIWMRFMKAAVPLFAQGKTEGAVVNAPDIEKLAASLEKPQQKPEAAKPDEETAAASADEAANTELPPTESSEIPSNSDLTPETRTEVAPAPPAKVETETVTICAVSGKRATLYCPKQVTRTFPKGSAPKSTCPLHPDPFAER